MVPESTILNAGGGNSSIFGMFALKMGEDEPILPHFFPKRLLKHLKPPTIFKVIRKPSIPDDFVTQERTTTAMQALEHGMEPPGASDKQGIPADDDDLWTRCRVGSEGIFTQKLTT